jgi:hypothetical protein
MLKLSHIAFIFALGLLISSCGSSESDKDKNMGNDTTAIKQDTGKLNELTEFKYDMVISNIPIPFDILITLNKSGVNYNRSVLNDPGNLKKYSQNDIKAVNLGIFGGDLAYVITFEQFSEVGGFLKSTKKLADDLGIPIAFDQHALSNYDKYKGNKDSLERIVFNSYSAVDKTLKSNERIGLASLVVTGGWIEGLYTSTKTFNNAAKSEKNKALYDKILNQKLHLDKLVGLLQEFSAGDKFFADLISDLNSLKAVYDGLSSKTELTQADVEAISKKAEEIRNKYANG